MVGILDITLERDGHDQPWGFRLQGGYDVGTPLSIQRILVGTPSEGVLKKGDVLLRISRTDAKGLTHQQAADLFTNTGNQISIQVKRTGVSTHIVNANPTSVPPPQPVPLTGGIALPGMSPLSTAKSRNTLQTDLLLSRGAVMPSTSNLHQSTSAPLSLTIQNQPYRTSPLIQPSAKVDFGPGSTQHLKMQADHLTGVKEPHPPMDSRAREFTMQQKVNIYTPQSNLPARTSHAKTFPPTIGWEAPKVTGTLQSLQYQQPSPPAVGSPLEPKFKTAAPTSGVPKSTVPAMHSQSTTKQFYNSPINLYSTENVAEVVKLNKMGLSGAPGQGPTSPTGLLHPNKIQQVFLSPPKDYNPKDSATWQALQEYDPTGMVDPEKLKNFSTLREHDPIYSEVYAPSKCPRQNSTSPHPPSAKTAQIHSNLVNDNANGDERDSFLHSGRSPVQSPPVLSPVAEFLPTKFGGKVADARRDSSSTASDHQQSAVLEAALAGSKPITSNTVLLDLQNVPMYETNSIGGRRKIAQSTTFNKLMMDVFGE